VVGAVVELELSLPHAVQNSRSPIARTAGRVMRVVRTLLYEKPVTLFEIVE